MKSRQTFQISLLQSIIAMAMFAFTLGLLINVGPLSTLVLAAAVIAVAPFSSQVSSRWRLMGSSRRAVTLVMAGAWIFGVFWISSLFWMHPKIYSNRLTTTYRNLLDDSNLNISMTRGEILLLTVSATLRSEDLFNKLRSDLRQRFSGEASLHIHWDIQTKDGLAIHGFDREWFTDQNVP